MVTAASAAGFIDLCAAFIALYIFPLLDPQLAADPSAQATLLDSAVELLVPLAALGVLASASTAINRHLQHPAAVAGAAGRTRRLYRLFAVLCASVGTLEFFFFVYPAAAAVGGHVGAQARALGVAAARVLPSAAAATFFLGMALIIVAHIRGAGGEGGGGVSSADGHIQGAAVSFLTKAAYAAAAALAWLVAIALCGHTAIY